MPTIDFYYGIGSRYSYLACTQLGQLADEFQCAIDWRPINSLRYLSDKEANPFEGRPVSGQYEWTYREQDAKRWADYYGVPFKEPRGRLKLDSELLARSCTAAKSFGVVAPFSRLLFEAVFSGALDIVDQSMCISIAEKLGIEKMKFVAAIESPAILKEMKKTMNAAKEAGVFGVPTFIVGTERFWGNDRLVLLRHHLEKSV